MCSALVLTVERGGGECEVLTRLERRADHRAAQLREHTGEHGTRALEVQILSHRPVRPDRIRAVAHATVVAAVVVVVAVAPCSARNLRNYVVYSVLC